MKRKNAAKIQLKLHLNVLFAILSVPVFAAVIVFLVCASVYFAGEIVLWPLPLLCAACALSIFIFAKKIYRPIKKLEQALKAVSDVENITEYELETDEGSDLFEVSESINKMIYRLKEYANREYMANILAKQAELNALQTQINPHFLYNTLDSIRGLALTEGQQNIAIMTKALSGLFRYSISKTGNTSTLREEIKNVEDYLTIQKLRFPDKFSFVKDIEADVLDYRLPKLTIQPIIENAVFHGLETKLGRGEIVLNAYATQKRLVISIEDDGVGMDEATLERVNLRLMGQDGAETKSIALTNVNDRIKLFFGEGYGMKVLSTRNVGTTVEISAPLEKESV